MKRNIFMLTLVMLLATFTVACGSLNKATPAALDDAAIEADVRAKLAEDIDTKALELSVEVDDGVVTLRGDVDSWNQRTKAQQAAQEVDGVRRVINNIRVR